MTNYTLETACAEHAESLAPRLRAADLAEIEASTGGDPLDVLLVSIALSDAAWTWFIDGVPHMIGGVSPHPTDPTCGVPWAMGSDEVSNHKGELLAMLAGRQLWASERYTRMENHVDARNKPALKFLRMAGFTIHPPEPFGVLGLPFHRFTLERTDV